MLNAQQVKPNFIVCLFEPNRVPDEVERKNYRIAGIVLGILTLGILHLTYYAIKGCCKKTEVNSPSQMHSMAKTQYVASQQSRRTAPSSSSSSPEQAAPHQAGEVLLQRMKTNASANASKRVEEYLDNSFDSLDRLNQALTQNPNFSLTGLNALLHASLSAISSYRKILDGQLTTLSVSDSEIPQNQTLVEKRENFNTLKIQIIKTARALINSEIDNGDEVQKCIALLSQLEELKI